MKESHSVSRKQLELNYDLFESFAPVAPVTDDEVESVLPSISELYERFEMCNERHFGGTLPAAEISYSNRLLAAGICYPIEKRIKIGVRYHKLFAREVYDTLLHEMIHLINPTHDSHFCAIARRVGAPLHARYHPDLRQEPRYLYRCPVCEAEYPRRRRLRETSCGGCSGRAYDSRFKLKLVGSARRRERLNNTPLPVA